MPTHIHLKTRDDLSHSDLTALLSYDSKTGIFRWKEGRGGRPAGAGNRNKLNGYTIIRLGDLYFRAHVLAWFYIHNEWPNGGIDHKNTERGSNSYDNIRPSNQSQNMANRPKTRKNTSGFKGVYWHARNQKWCAIIKVNYKQRYLGSYDDATAAAAAYDRAAIENWGDFALTNFPAHEHDVIQDASS